jgi:hypothetical protein
MLHKWPARHYDCQCKRVSNSSLKMTKCKSSASSNPIAKLQSPRPKRCVWVVIEGETCADTGSDPTAHYPDNADVSVVGVFSSLQTAQRVALLRMKAKGIRVREQVGGSWTELIDDSGVGGLSSPCGAWSVSIEKTCNRRVRSR